MTKESAAAMQVRNVIYATVRYVPTEAVIADDPRLIEDMGADSLDIVEMRIAIEEKLAVEFTDEEWDAVRTIGDAVNLAEKHQSTEST